MLDRERQFRELEEEEKSFQSKGAKDYLSGFKVASIEKKVVGPKESCEEEIIDSASDEDAGL